MKRIVLWLPILIAGVWAHHGEPHVHSEESIELTDHEEKRLREFHQLLHGIESGRLDHRHLTGPEATRPTFEELVQLGEESAVYDSLNLSRNDWITEVEGYRTDYQRWLDRRAGSRNSGGGNVLEESSEEIGAPRSRQRRQAEGEEPVEEINRGGRNRGRGQNRNRGQGRNQNRKKNRGEENQTEGENGSPSRSSVQGRRRGNAADGDATSRREQRKENRRRNRERNQQGQRGSETPTPTTE